MSQQYLNKKDIQGQALLDKTKSYLVKKFNQLDKLFSYSSSFGQVVLVLMNHTKLIMYYIKDSVNEMSFHTARRKDSIYGLAQLQGHNAHRGFGATGSISLTIKKDVISSNQSLSGSVFIPNYTRLRCNENGLLYYLNLGDEYIEYPVNASGQISLNIMQGVVRVETFKGNGEDNQTYSLSFNNTMVDMNKVRIEVNGEPCEILDSFSEFRYGTLSCIVRTGLTSGIDIIFGKKIYGLIPESGYDIQVFYPVIAGSIGNVKSPTFIFQDPFYTSTGTIDVNKFFSTTVVDSPDFGSDSEDVELTRIIAPNVNKNRIIFDKKSVKYWLDRLNLFGEVKVFNDNQPNVIETYVYPKLENLIGDSEDYFSLDKNKIFLDDVTKKRLLDNMNPSKSQNIDVVLKNPIVKAYSMSIKADVFRQDKAGIPVDLTKIKETIRREVSNEMLKLKRTNKIPKSDVIKLIDNIAVVDSVDVEFIVEEASMLDQIGNIIVESKEIALPTENFVSSDGLNIINSIIIDLSYV